jgi:hypothetical protein
MSSKKEIGLDFEIDKLTRSIENVVTGDFFPTDITLIAIKDLKIATKRYGWLFDWKGEFAQKQKAV